MEPCYYGSGCTRKGCIYRHDGDIPDAKKTNDPCLAFLANTCSFTAGTCKKRHPLKEEADRLRAKYAQIMCRHGDDCRTNSCLYSHPRDEKTKVEPVAFLENAFPPLSGSNNYTSSMVATGGGRNTSFTSHMVPRVAWKAAPVVSFATPNMPTTTRQQQEQMPTPISAQAPAWFPGNPQAELLSLSQPQPPPPQFQYQTIQYPAEDGNYSDLGVNHNNDDDDAQHGEHSFPAMSPSMVDDGQPSPNDPPSSSTMGKKSLNVNAKMWTPVD